MPQVNLKDRIAALQQRATSPVLDTQGPSPSTSPSMTSRIPVSGTATGSLRDKIANFERKGAVPTPRGRFGTGAPPVGDNGTTSKKRGELYGNRDPDLAKSADAAALLVRKRTVSTSDSTARQPFRPTSPTSMPPLPPLQPHYTGDAVSILGPRFPSNFEYLDRRSVSDVLPRATHSVDVHELKTNGDLGLAPSAKDKDDALPTPAVIVTETIVEEPSTIMKAQAPMAFPSSNESKTQDTAPVEPSLGHGNELQTENDMDSPGRMSTETIKASAIQGNAEEKKEKEDEKDEAREEETTKAPLGPTEVESPSAVANEIPTPVVALVLDLPVTQDNTETNFDAQTVVLESSAPAIIEVSPPSSAKLSINTDTDVSSAIDENTASSDSVHTPSDTMSFHSAESDDDKAETPEAGYTSIVDEITVSLAQPVVAISTAASAPALELTRSITPPPSIEVSVSPPATPVPRPAVPAMASQTDLVDSPVVTPVARTEEPGRPQPAPEHVSHAPVLMPPPSVPSPPPVSPSEKAMFDRKEARKSFHAVVHRKIRETSPVEPTVLPPAPAPAPAPVLAATPDPAPTATRPPAPAPARSVPSFPPPKTSAQRVQSVLYQEPESPSFSDLAVLVADAALLEEQLATPGKKPLSTPTFNLHPAIPEVRESQSFERPRPEIQMTAPPPDKRASQIPTSVSLQTPPTQSFSSHGRARTDSESQQSNRNSQGPRYFSSLRLRKGSMPGAYPRTSVCSEMSTESSVLVGIPPSPPAYDQDGVYSDANSVRSSNKSWKSPKKGIGRASSWLFRGKNKSSPTVVEESAPQLPPVLDSSPSLLSPHSPSRGQSSPTSARRPASWVSISSNGSGEVFDNEFFDSFPSVPGDGSSGSSSRPVRSQTVGGRPNGRS